VDNLVNLEPLRDRLPYDYRGDGVLQYRGGLTDSSLSGVWILLYYGAVLFVVSHTKSNWGKPSERMKKADKPRLGQTSYAMFDANESEA
jgi:hypothetical protein